LQLLIDLLIITAVYLLVDKTSLNPYFLPYMVVLWLFISYFFGFYKVFRYTRAFSLLTLIGKQFLIFVLGYFAFFGAVRQGNDDFRHLFILSTIIGSISITKLLWLLILKKYRSLGNNSRSTVIIGFDDSSRNIIKLFKSKANLGYNFLGFFSDDIWDNDEYLGSLELIPEFVAKNEVDEIYCSVSTLSKEQINNINRFAIDKNIDLKLIPNFNELYSKNQSVAFYDDSLMVLNVNKLPFEFAENFYIKRIFDICFSLFVSLAILSWLMPILWVLVKLESKGPLIFKQGREGINGKEFTCYKFRSMRINKMANQVHATENDSRITKIGAFLRKSSMDELPQFFNVLLGDMSVVGPRPHLESLSLEYQKEVDDYLKRHIVKPGITGLAQISGYRGEVKIKSDIKNRVRLDIFYIENWSFSLDVKIIIQTLLGVFKGDEKAY
jgi:putative colanic acid biosynthesis UDP-glucose lipid carrier transferase